MAGPGVDLDRLIPHRGSMRLVDTAIVTSDTTTETKSVVRARWPLCTGPAVSTIIAVELVAQTASVQIGWRRRDVEAQGGRGMLVGVRAARFLTPTIPIGTHLTTEIRLLRELFNYAIFKGTVSDAQGVLAEIELQAFRPDDA